MKIRFDVLSDRGKLYLLTGVLLCAFIVLILLKGMGVAVVFAIIPLAIYMLIRVLDRPFIFFSGVFFVTYFIMGLTRYVPGLQGGFVVDGLLLVTLLLLIVRNQTHPFKWHRARNSLTLFSGVWLVYCLLLVFNPLTSVADWAAGVRGLAVYLFIFPVLTAVLLDNYKKLKMFLIVWAVLTLLAVFKALVQKYFGFDAAEKYWLYALGGSTTHLLYTGTRYFSFFTDAASFGCAMGLSMVVFSISAFYIKPNWLRVFFLIVALFACYGMIISGTRAAIAIPFAGFSLFILLSKRWGFIITGVILIACAFIFFKYTYIGHGNAEIRRMRSAFNVTEDASFQVRKKNQAEMRTFMVDHPFGIGVGKAKRTEPGDHMYQLPTDTSLVYVWVETGLVGLFLFLSVFIATFAVGVYDVWFKIQNNELRGIICALLAGVFGMLVCSYGNEVLQQFPNGPTIYMCMAFIMMGRKLDKLISDESTS